MRKFSFAFAFIMSFLVITPLFAVDYSILTPEEKKIYDRGDIGDVRAVAAGLAGTFVGFGVGHAIIKSYRDIGWVFTVGEAASVGVLIGGAAWAAGSARTGQDYRWTAGSTTLAVIGTVGLFGFRIWELIDIWLRPWDMQDDFRRVDRKLHDASGGKGSELETPRLSLALLPPMTRDDNYKLGFQLKF